MGILDNKDVARQVAEVDIDTEDGGKVRVIIVKIVAAMGSFAGFGFTVPSMLLEGGGYSSEEMALNAVKLFLCGIVFLLSLLSLFA